jgi:DNA-binding NtrC family response regulator
MARTLRLAERAAKSSIPVLIEGESGVGKELLARAIQGSSDRRGKPFVTVNCGALPENLVESILFGHEKGAFTGATEKHAGKFAEANAGTLFLDEISELPLDAQVKLLRALQEGEIDPVGARRPVKVDIRLVSATNQNLIELVKRGRFREDLFYRLNVFPIQMPPLRERLEDLPVLIEHLVQRQEQIAGRHLRLDKDAMNCLARNRWPGNVRELANLLERLAILFPGQTIAAADLPERYRSMGNTAWFGSGVHMLAPAQPEKVSRVPPGLLEQLLEVRDTEFDDPAQRADTAEFADAAEFAETAEFPETDAFADTELFAATKQLAAAAQLAEQADFAAVDQMGLELPRGGMDLKDHLSAIEIGLIRKALEEADGTVAEAARLLRMRRTTLVEKLRKYRLSA